MDAINTSNETTRTVPTVEAMNCLSGSNISQSTTSECFIPSSSLLSTEVRCEEAGGRQSKRGREKSREASSVDATDLSALLEVSASSSSLLGALENEDWREKEDERSVGSLRCPSSSAFRTAATHALMATGTTIVNEAASSLCADFSGTSTFSPFCIIGEPQKEEKVCNEEPNEVIDADIQQLSYCPSDSSISRCGDDKEVSHSGNVVAQSPPSDNTVKAMKRTCREEESTAKKPVVALGELPRSDAAIDTECDRSPQRKEEECISFPVVLPHDSGILPSSSLSVCILSSTSSSAAEVGFVLVSKDSKKAKKATVTDHSHSSSGDVGEKTSLCSLSTSERPLQSSKILRENQKSLVDVQDCSSSDGCQWSEDVEEETFQVAQSSFHSTPTDKIPRGAGEALPVSHVSSSICVTEVPTDTFVMKSMVAENSTSPLSSAETVNSAIHARKSSSLYSDFSRMDMMQMDRKEEDGKRNTIREAELVSQMGEEERRAMTSRTTTTLLFPAPTSNDENRKAEMEENARKSREATALVKVVVTEKEKKISQEVLLERKTENTARETNVKDRIEGENPFLSSATTRPHEAVASVSCDSLCGTVSHVSTPADGWIDPTHSLVYTECGDSFHVDTTLLVKEKKEVAEQPYSSGGNSMKPAHQEVGVLLSERAPSARFLSKAKEKDENYCCAASDDAMHFSALQSHPTPMELSSTRSIHTEVCGGSAGIPLTLEHLHSRRSNSTRSSCSTSSTTATPTPSSSTSNHKQVSEDKLKTGTVPSFFPLSSSSSAFIIPSPTHSNVAENVNDVLFIQKSVPIPTTRIEACTTAPKAVEEERAEPEPTNDILSVKNFSANHFGSDTTAAFDPKRVVSQEEMLKKFAHAALVECEKYREDTDAMHSSSSSLVSHASMLSDSTTGGSTKEAMKSQEGEENEVKHKGVIEKAARMRFTGVPQSSSSVFPIMNLEKRRDSNKKECNGREGEEDKMDADKCDEEVNECTRSHLTFPHTDLAHLVPLHRYKSTVERLTVLRELEQDTRKQLQESMMEYVLFITKCMECERDMLVRRMQLLTQESIFRRVLRIEKEKDYDFLCEKSELECVVGESLFVMERPCKEEVRENCVTLHKGRGGTSPLSLLATQELFFLQNKAASRAKDSERNTADNGAYRKDAVLLEGKASLLLTSTPLQCMQYTKMEPYEAHHREHSVAPEGVQNDVEREEPLERKQRPLLSHTIRKEGQGWTTEWDSTAGMGDDEEDTHEKERKSDSCPLLVSSTYDGNTNEAVPYAVVTGEDLLCSLPVSPICRRDNGNESSQQEKKSFSSISSLLIASSSGSSLQSFHSFSSSSSHRSVAHRRRESNLTDSLDGKLSDSSVTEERYSNDLEVFCSSIPSSFSSIVSSIDVLSERDTVRDVTSETKSNDIKRVRKRSDTNDHHSEMECSPALAAIQGVTPTTEEGTTWCPWKAEEYSLTEHLPYTECPSDSGKAAEKNGQNTVQERSLNQFSVTEVPNVGRNLKTTNLPVELMKYGSLPHETSRKKSRRRGTGKHMSSFSNTPVANFSSLTFSCEGRPLRDQNKSRREKLAGECAKSLPSGTAATWSHAMQTERRAAELEHHSPLHSQSFSSSSSVSSSTSSWISSYASCSVKKSTLKRYSDRDVYTFSAIQ